MVLHHTECLQYLSPQAAHARSPLSQPLSAAAALPAIQRCDVCAPGSYQDKESQTACIECPAGTYSEMTGAKAATDCKKAPRGNYAEGTGNDGFNPCLAGTFQDKEGQGACKVRAVRTGMPVRAAGHRVWAVGSCECWPPAGCCHLVPTVAAGGQPAAPGPLSFGLLSPFCHCSLCGFPPLPSPQDCPPGNACPTGSINPKPCAPGFFAEPKSPFCRECPKGQMQNLAGQRACKVSRGEHLSSCCLRPRMPSRSDWQLAWHTGLRACTRLLSQLWMGCACVSLTPPPAPPHFWPLRSPALPAGTAPTPR